jgi:hypothetical protein
MPKESAAFLGLKICEVSGVDYRICRGGGTSYLSGQIFKPGYMGIGEHNYSHGKVH